MTDVREVLATGEVIEVYPDDTPYPSRLVLGWRGNRPLHVVAADNIDTDETIIITTYEPGTDQWEPGFPTETQAMKCVVCKHGETRPGRSTVTLTRAATTLVVKGVPARVCANCGEEYVDESTTERLIQTMDEAARAGVEVDVREYAVA